VDAALQLDLPVVFPVLKCAAVILTFDAVMYARLDIRSFLQHGLDVIITSFFIDFDDGSQDSFNASTFPYLCCSCILLPFTNPTYSPGKSSYHLAAGGTLRTAFSIQRNHTPAIAPSLSTDGEQTLDNNWTATSNR
jgi:hypothetical protein